MSPTSYFVGGTLIGSRLYIPKRFGYDSVRSSGELNNTHPYVSFNHMLEKDLHFDTAL